MRLLTIYLHNFTTILYLIQHGRGEQQTINTSKARWPKMIPTEMRHNINIFDFIFVVFLISYGIQFKAQVMKKNDLSLLLRPTEFLIRFFYLKFEIKSSLH